MGENAHGKFKIVNVTRRDQWGRTRLEAAMLSSISRATQQTPPIKLQHLNACAPVPKIYTPSYDSSKLILLYRTFMVYRWFVDEQETNYLQSLLLLMMMILLLTAAGRWRDK